MIKEKTVKLFSSQFDAFNFTTQFAAAVAGVQSGKTFCGAYWTGKKIQEFPDKNGIIVAPTYKILQQATLKKFFDVFPELRKYYKEQKGEINLPTGGTVFVRSADSPLGIEGITAHWWWLDEGGMCSILTWIVLRSRVSMTGGQGLITTTPYNMGWLYQEFFIPWRDGIDKSLSFFTWQSIDNPYFNKDFYDAEKQRLRPEEFSRRYEGQFNKMMGLVYDLPKELEVTPMDKNIKTEARIMGVDWGFRNPAAIWVGYLRDNEWFTVDEWKMAERTTAEIIQVINNKLSEHKIRQVFPDPAEPDRIEECRRANIPVMETNKDIKGGVSFIQQLIREKRFKVCNDCIETLDEMSMYHYPEPQEGKSEKDEPEKFNDHLCFTKDTIITLPLGKIINSQYTGKKDVYEFMGSKVTANHPYLTQRGFVRLDTLRYSDRIVVWKNKLLMELSLEDTQIQTAVNLKTILYLLQRNISAIKQNVYTDIYGRSVMGRYLRGLISTTLMVIRLIMIYLTSNLFQIKSISKNITKYICLFGEKIWNMQLSLQLSGINQRMGVNFINGSGSNRGRRENNIPKFVDNAGKNIKHISQNNQNSATIIARLKHCGQENVYSTTTTNGFFAANGVIVSNCDAMRYAIYSYKPIGNYDFKPSSPILPYYPSLGF